MSEKQEVTDVSDENNSWLMYPIKKLSDIFLPIAPAIIAGLVLIGINILLAIPLFNGQTASFIDVYPQYSAIVDVLNTFANAPFIFLPILVAFSATRVFGGNPFLGATLGMIMVHPELLSFYNFTNGVEPNYWQFFNGQQLVVGDAGNIVIADSYIAAIGYQGTMLPILVMSWVLAKLEIVFNKIIPRFLDVFLVPVLALFITAAITFVLMPPMLQNISRILDVSSMPFGIYTPYINGCIIVLVGFVSYTLTTKKSNKVKVDRYPSNNNQPEVAVIAPDDIAKGNDSVIDTDETITQDTVEMLTDNTEKPDAKESEVAINKESETVIEELAVIVPSTDDVETTNTEAEPTKTETETVQEDKESDITPIELADNEQLIADEWVMPLEGDIVELSDVPDTAFASGAMGAGFGIKPTGGAVVSPVHGVVSAIFPTNHAICIDTSDDIEMLIHVGIDTVALNGEGFTLITELGAEVTPNTPLIEVDWDLINDKALSSITPILFTSMDEGQKIKIRNGVPILVH